MDSLGRAVGDAIGGIGDALSGLMSGVSGAFSAALRDLTAIVPGGLLGAAAMIGVVLAASWWLLHRGR